ncbi:predicted protein [Sclerotinia sclerotiorum 1980 UF-70]|uniref:Uncharacterized protein n=1 Tax=Sclerotinia sclerotiorum (strain ATCC 18683 / 1980 / Ss-1) TaxID=665079 RepID=A7F7E6_SCLS1|nr:predicted protein [Sclerotinia sclerotiorum 1980 UF-70]EDN98667.1 predicted protein [Sclerotinia sclerotiorum 1980 UF-70]
MTTAAVVSEFEFWYGTERNKVVEEKRYFGKQID